MKKFQPQLNVANFICKFDEAVLLDLAQEIVLPAFLDAKLQRPISGSTKYFIMNAQLWNVPNSPGAPLELAIVGRFVKEGEISRDQVLRAGEIVRDRKVLESAPSSIFVLFLSNHKLLYVREVAGAPSLENFGATIKNFIKYKRKEFVDKEYLRLKDAEDRTQRKTKKELFELYPSPSVEVVPLSNEQTMTEFIDHYSILKSVEVRLLDTNHEIDNSKLFAGLRKSKEQLGSDVLLIRNESKGQLGLNKEQAAKLVAVPAEEGNSRIKLLGLDAEGRKLEGNDENFKLSIPIDLKQGAESTDPSPTISKMIVAYLDALDKKVLTVQKGNDVALSKLSALRRSLGI